MFCVQNGGNIFYCDGVADLRNPCRPILRRIILLILERPAVGVSRIIGGTVIHPIIRDNLTVLIIHVRDTVTYENQIFPIWGNTVIPVQQLLARKHSGMGVCSATNRLLDCAFNGVVTGGKICKRSYVCLLVEDNDADLDRCACIFSLSLKLLEHRDRLFLKICAHGLIKHEHNVGRKAFLNARDGEGHVGFVVAICVLFKIGCGLGDVDVPILLGVRLCPAAVLAGLGDGIAIFLDGKRTVLVAVGVLVVSCVDGMAYHLTVFPNGRAVDVDNGSSCVAIAIFHVELK